MQTFKKGKIALAMASAFFIGGTLSGCDSGNLPSAPSAGAENPTTLNPTGTIQGNLKDSSTGEPIVGATIDIGVATATTNSRGVFTLRNVPATASVAINGANTNVGGTYEGIIDFRTVTSPVNMTNAATAVRYPDTRAVSWTVEFTSLEDASTDTGAGGETLASNHDTPVTGLIAGQAVTAGKLSTSLSGEIRIKSSNALVAEAYTVQLWDNAGPTLKQEITTVISTTDAEAVAKFTFTGVAAGTSHDVVVFNADNSLTDTVTFTTPADNQAASLAVGGKQVPLLVKGTDVAAPYIYKIAISDGTTSFENGADIGAAASASIIYSFSEPMLADGYSTGVTPTTATELYDHITANWVSAKAGNVAHSMAWNATMDELTVSIPTLAGSSVYKVTLNGANTLQDTNNTALSAGNFVVDFTTGGGVAVAAPVITLVNDASIDVGVAPIFDWVWQAGAASYNVYRSTSTGGVVTGGMDFQINRTTSDYAPAAPAYISGELPVTYDYIVKAVNSDGVESDGSAAVTVNDAVGPTVAAAVCNGGGAGLDVLRVTFSENVAETAAEVVGSYTVTEGGITPTPTTATLFSPAVVDLKLSGNCAAGTVAVAIGVTDINGNALGKTAAVPAGAASGAIGY